jgi:flagellin-like hook-associated protein FlgL
LAAGRLEGLDGAAFGALIQRGVGRHRAFGYGMVLLRADSPFTALLELKDGMERDHRQTLTYAGERIDRILKYMQQKHGEIAAQARTLADRGERVETEITATQTMLSDVRDVDMTDAIVRFQQLQTALQANLSTASQVLNLSLLDYLD